MRKPPCSDNPVFIDPDNSTPAEINQAITQCHACPLLQVCASVALTSGTLIQFPRGLPANGVIQGGVWCRGDQWTARLLARNAGVSMPVVAPTRKTTPPTHCVECDKPMVARKFGEPTDPDVLTHAAHGLCRVCDARARRQKSFVPKRPKRSTIFDWKEKHARNRSNRDPGRRAG